MMLVFLGVLMRYISIETQRFVILREMMWGLLILIFQWFRYFVFMEMQVSIMVLCLAIVVFLKYLIFRSIQLLQFLMAINVLNLVYRLVQVSFCRGLFFKISFLRVVFRERLMGLDFLIGRRDRIFLRILFYVLIRGFSLVMRSYFFFLVLFQ